MVESKNFLSRNLKGIKGQVDRASVRGRSFESYRENFGLPPAEYMKYCKILDIGPELRILRK